MQPEHTNRITTFSATTRHSVPPSQPGCPQAEEIKFSTQQQCCITTVSDVGYVQFPDETTAINKWSHSKIDILFYLQHKLGASVVG